MVSEWEKQILAYCIRVSRGAVNTGMIKMSIFPEDKAVSLGGITAVQFIDIVSYIMRLQENLKDPIRRRGFRCSLEIGSNVKAVLEQENYDLIALETNFSISQHDGYGNEIHFCFNYEPSITPAMVFEDTDVVELNSTDNVNNLLNNQDIYLELAIHQKFMQEFDFIDDKTSNANFSNQSFDNTVQQERKKTKS